MCTRAVTRISKHLRFSHYSNSFAVSASSTETQSTTRLSRAPFLTSFALPSSLGDASAERCGYTAKISSPRQTSGVRSRACRGTSFPRIQSFSFTRLECPGRNASPGCRNRSCNAHLSGRFANRTPSSVLSMDVEFSQDVRTNQPGGCVMETPRPASTMTSFPTARASASPSPSFAPDVCFPSFALKSRRGFFCSPRSGTDAMQYPISAYSPFPFRRVGGVHVSVRARAKSCAHILRRTWYSMSTPAQSETYVRSWSSRASVGSLDQKSRSISPRTRYDLSKGESEATGPSPCARYAEGISSSSSRRCALCSVNASTRDSTPPLSTSSRSKGINSARTRFRRYFGDALLGSSRHVSARDSRNATSSRFRNDKSGRPKTPSRGRMPAMRDM